MLEGRKRELFGEYVPLDFVRNNTVEILMINHVEVQVIAGQLLGMRS